jgi:ribonuclease R
VLDSLDNLYRLFKVLHRARAQRGTVDLDLPETRIVYDANRKIERIVPLVRNDAHRLIEECMLAANVCAAELLARNEVPALYRVHQGPSADKLEDLKRFLGELGLRLGGGSKPSPADYAAIIDQLEGRPDAHLVQTVLLRSLSQAVYSPDNAGHFALGYPNYTHFTSPIRRYPDLLVHRAIKSVIQKKKIQRDEEAHKRVLAQGEHCSTTERRADEATRDVVAWLKAEYMMDRVGDVFDGVISGVTSFGIFVELKEIYVEGLVHITALGNDYYHFDPGHHRLTGERSGMVYRLGDAVRVRVVRVSLDDARIDFEPESPEAVRQPSRARAGKKRKGGRPSGRRRRKKG